MECLSPNIHVPDLSAGPKKKRFQVHSACTQCKKSHAACSMTRPCERCVRVGESHLCVDVPRKRRGKQAQQTPLQVINPIPLDPSPSLLPQQNHVTVVPEDGLAPIDEISDFLFDGIENNLLTDSNLRNVALLDGSALSANTLLHTRPLFNSNLSYGASNYSSGVVLSPQTSSSDVSPVPSPYNNNNTSPNASPIQDINSSSYNNTLNYIPNGANVYTPMNGNVLYTQAYTSPNTYSNPTFDTESINDHINNLLSGHISPNSQSSITPNISDSLPISPNATNPISSNISTLPLYSIPSTSDQWTEDTSVTAQSVPENTSSENTSIDKALVPASSSLSTKRNIADKLAVFNNPQDLLTNSNAGSCDQPKCFCHKVQRPGKVQLVCVHDEKDPDSHSAKFESNDPPYNPNASLHLVVESLVREVQSLKRELRGEQPIPLISADNTSALDDSPKGPAVAVWDLVSQKLSECNDTFATLFTVDRSQPCYITDIAQCPAYFLRLCAANKTTWHEKRRFSLKRPEGDINLVVAIDINGTCVVTTFWKY